ncbi:CENP-B homolog protein 2-like [Rhizophagus clarus]|uniref:CENP-B homolog protein 2-like n=1 Tax=Rhizophagus clarus TaxID=94130 RepID=A0A8H3LIX2_9GLOM|nr:CENP-B homolog protein 2-like [Rhizophagus clarus]
MANWWISSRWIEPESDDDDDDEDNDGDNNDDDNNGNDDNNDDDNNGNGDNNDDGNNGNADKNDGTNEEQNDDNNASEVTNPEAKQHKAVAILELKLALKEFVLTYQHRVILSDALLIEKAKLLAEELEVSEGTLQLQKFKDRNGIRQVKLQGEAYSADENAIVEALPLLQSKCVEYLPEQIYNMDETRLFYWLEPDQTLVTKQLARHKKNKERFSIALCTNANGLHKLNSLIIEWLKEFDHHIGQRYGGQCVLLLIDNCKSHKIENLILSYVENHTKILFNNILLNDIHNDDSILDNELARAIEALNLSNRMRVKEFITIFEEVVVYEIPKDLEVTDLFKNEININHSDEIDDSIEEKTIGIKKALQSLKTVHTFLLQQENMSEQIKLVGKIENFIKKKQINSMQQTTLD